MEKTNMGGSAPRSGSGNMPQDQRKQDDMGKKPGQPSPGGSSQDWQRDKDKTESQRSGSSESGHSGKTGQSSSSGNQSR